MIDGNTPVRSDTQVGLEFQGLTGIAAISFTGGSDEAPPPKKGPDGIPELTADPEGTLNTQEKIRVALRNVDKVISDNEVAVKDTLRNFESVHRPRCPATARRSPASSRPPKTASPPSTTRMDKTKDFLGGLASDKYGGELLPTVISMRELIESFDKKSGLLIADNPKDVRRAQPVHQQGRPEIRQAGQPRAARR